MSKSIGDGARSEILAAKLLRALPKVVEKADPWVGATNERVWRLNSDEKGRLGVDLFINIYGGVDVSKRYEKKICEETYLHDVELDDMQVESKLACYSHSARNFHFSALRPDSEFTHAWLVCVDLTTVRAFLVPKGGLKMMGKRKEQITIPRYKIPRWIAPFEVSLDKDVGKTDTHEHIYSGGLWVAEQEKEPWLTDLPSPQQPDTQTRLNYVIPNKAERLLAQYCVQTEMKSGPLVRRLITDFLKGDVGINIQELDHPKGRRTSVDLPGRLLAAFETRCEEIGAPTKAAVIAALLGDFLPPRVKADGVEKIAIGIPTSIYTKIYKRYGPGPDEEVLVEALCDLIQKNESKAIPAELEA